MQWVSSIVVVVVMLLAAATANLKGKLSEKMRWRPTQMVMKKMPDGTAELSELPRRKADAVEGDEVADAEYCQAVARVANAFGRQRRSVTTAAEHVMYMRMFDGWLVEFLGCSSRYGAHLKRRAGALCTALTITCKQICFI